MTNLSSISHLKVELSLVDDELESNLYDACGADSAAENVLHARTEVSIQDSAYPSKIEPKLPGSCEPIARIKSNPPGAYVSVKNRTAEPSGSCVSVKNRTPKPPGACISVKNRTRTIRILEFVFTPTVLSFVNLFGHMAFLPNYFSEQKGVQEKYLNMVVKINPVYWLKRNQHMARKKKFLPITALSSINRRKLFIAQK